MGADICASEYLESLLNAFRNYMQSQCRQHTNNHRLPCLKLGGVQHLSFCRNKNTAISGMCGWWHTQTQLCLTLFFGFQFCAITVCYFLPIPPLFSKSTPHHLSTGPGSVLCLHFNLLGESC